MTQMQRNDPQDSDQEIMAMSDVSKALKVLPADVQKRVLDWAYSRFLSVSPALDSGNPASRKADGPNKFEATTNMIALKLGGNDCSSLMRAAACHLTLVKGQERFSRQELLNEMKGTSYYKETYTGNMTYYIKRLLKEGFLNEPQKDMYAIVPQHLKNLEQKLA